MDITNLLEKSLTYTNVLYRQAYVKASGFNNVYELESKYSDIPSDALLFYLPTVSSADSTTNTCKLKIKYPQNSNGTIYYISKEFNIVVETNTGATRTCTKGDIIANRLCLFRFKLNTKEIILCNSPLYNEINVTKITATSAEFLNVPKVKKSDNVNSVSLVTNEELESLTNRIERLEQKILFGDEDPSIVLADKPAGTIYLKYEDEV